MSNHARRVYTLIKKHSCPIDPQKIARELEIGWGTALRYALELAIAGKVKALKTSKSWVFWVELSKERE